MATVLYKERSRSHGQGGEDVLISVDVGLRGLLACRSTSNGSAYVPMHDDCYEAWRAHVFSIACIACKFSCTR